MKYQRYSGEAPSHLEPRIAESLDKNFSNVSGGMDSRLLLLFHEDGVLVWTDHDLTVQMAGERIICECGATIAFQLQCKHLFSTHGVLSCTVPAFLIHQCWMSRVRVTICQCHSFISEMQIRRWSTLRIGRVQGRRKQFRRHSSQAIPDIGRSSPKKSSRSAGTRGRQPNSSNLTSLRPVRFPPFTRGVRFGL
jgi:hypothetical protein